MDYTGQIKLFKTIFKNLGLNVDLCSCVDDIFSQLTIEQCNQIFSLVDDKYVKSYCAYHVGLNKPEYKKVSIDFVNDSKYAYYWALYIGNRDIMIDRITDSKYAYLWALYIGNRDIMIDRITDSQYAYLWALYIGNRDVMIDRITDSQYAYYWVKDIGDHDIMIDRITDSKYAYYWALEIGDSVVMLPNFVNSNYIFEYIQYTNSRNGIKELLTDQHIIRKWVEKFGDKEYFINKFPELFFT